MGDCVVCGREMRRKDSPPDGRPYRDRYGKCHSCRQRELTDRRRHERKMTPEFARAILEDKMWMDGYVMDRRIRRVPPLGFRVDDVEEQDADGVWAVEMAAAS